MARTGAAQSQTQTQTQPSRRLARSKIQNIQKTYTAARLLSPRRRPDAPCARRRVFQVLKLWKQGTQGARLGPHGTIDGLSTITPAEAFPSVPLALFEQHGVHNLASSP